MLIAFGSYARNAEKIQSVAFVAGIIACGVLLLLLALMGYVAVWRRQQVLLFIVRARGRACGMRAGRATDERDRGPWQFMVVIALLALVQFVLSVGALALNETQLYNMLFGAWKLLSDASKNDVQRSLNCCGFSNRTLPSDNPTGPGTQCPGVTNTTGPDCGPELVSMLRNGLRVVGAVGLIVCFVEVRAAPPRPCASCVVWSPTAVAWPRRAQFFGAYAVFRFRSMSRKTAARAL